MSRKTVGKKGKAGGIPARSPSVESSASQTTIATPRVARRSSLEQQLVSFNGVTTFGQYLFDTCCPLIYCAKHQSILLAKVPRNKGLWLPFFPVRQTDSWTTAIESKLKILMQTPSKDILPVTKAELCHILRLQVPNACKFVHRCTYFTQLNHEKDPNMACCQAMQHGKWCPVGELAPLLYQELWGPEPAIFGDYCINQTIEKGTYTEYTLRDALKYYPRENPKTFQDELLKSAGFSEKDITRVYADYVQHAYPSQYFVYTSFQDYMVKLGWTSNDMDLGCCYRSICFHKSPYMSFHEFVLGVAAMEKATSHGGHPGELRCGYICRYYDANLDSHLDRNEMRHLSYDMLRLKNKPCDDEAIEAELLRNYNTLNVAPNELVPCSLLMTHIGSMTFRGTSILFRCTFSICQQISMKRVYDSLSQLQSTTALDATFGTRRPKGTCVRCKPKRYALATHCVRIAPDGTILEPIELGFDDSQVGSKERRVLSQYSFSGDTVGNRMLDWIRDFANNANLLSKSMRSRLFKSKQSHNFWVSADRGQLANAVIKLCQEAEAIFKRETRCIKINSPCYVFGDIHGNLRDLMIYERTIWHKGPICTSDSLLFLGDYVDRGDYSLECVAYLLSCKVLNPDKFYLLRGNHELRPIQSVFTFQKECYEKFGKFGQAIWDACNKVFDALPLCAIIDENVFCAHGGIPTSATKIDELQQIPTPLPDPENQSPAAWEMLWNDPVTGTEFGEHAEMLRLQSGSNAFSNLQGFLPNAKRGTAYYFSEEAVNRFLTANGLSYIIRGHEVIPPGFQFHVGGRVITVFSSSRYCNGINEAASIYVEQEKLRVMKLDTTG